MSAIVDYTFYTDTYMGTDVAEASFPALCARAEDVIGAMTRWAVDSTTISSYPARTQTLYKKAICAQADYFAVNGMESAIGTDGRGFTVGKVSVNSRTGEDLRYKGSLSGSISPLATMYLEQTGLMNPQVATAPDLPCVGWW